MILQSKYAVQAEIEIGDGLPDIRHTKQCLDALKKAGFEVSFTLSFRNCHLPLNSLAFS